MSEVDNDGISLLLLSRTAYEKGEIDKAEGYLREVVHVMGRTHHISHQALKSLSDIAYEHGRFEVAINTSLDLLDAQIITYGVNHPESAKTIVSIRTICKSTGNDEMANEIDDMVQTAATYEKEGRKMKGLRTNKEKVSSEESLQDKILKLLIGKLAEIFKGGSDNKLPGTLILGTIAGVVIASQLVFFLLSISISHDSGRQLLAEGSEYTTADGRKKMELTSASELNVHSGENKAKLNFRVFGHNWRDVGPLMTSSFFDKERWVIEHPEGLQDITGITYYHVDAPELAIVHQMIDIVLTANNYYRDRGLYPKNIRQISQRNFRFLNPFTMEKDFPTIRTQFLTDLHAPDTAAFFKKIQHGAHWAGELDYYPGAIECCRVVYSSSPGDQNFLIHGCDRNGIPIADSYGKTLLLKSFNGSIEQDEASIDLALRNPTIWVLRAPPNLVPFYIRFLKYRFLALYGTTTVLLVAVNYLLRNSDVRPQAVILLALSTLILAASVFGAYAP